jgi:PAS domain S-box-containing protein
MPSIFAAAAAPNLVPVVVLLSLGVAGLAIAFFLLRSRLIAARSEAEAARAEAARLAAMPASAAAPVAATLRTSSRVRPNVELEMALASVFEGVIFTSSSGVVGRLNEAALALLGKGEKEVVGQPISEVLRLEPEDHPGTRLDLLDELRHKALPGPFEGACRYEPPGKEPILVELAGAPLFDAAETGGLKGFVVVVRDIGERRRFEAEQNRAARLESLALLAGGIAHDFNNLLTILLGNLSLLQADEKLPSTMVEPLTEAEKAVLRARGLADQLLTFASGSAPKTRAHSVADLIRESVSFVFRGAKTRCELSLPDDLKPAEIDPQQIHQVLNNLLINARQAMPEGGLVEVKAENLRVGVGMSKLRPGSYVKVVIRDHGPGIDPAVQAKIFDPYFTTKKDGTGLGLSTSSSIIKRHRGIIEVDSSQGDGATFTVLLPAARGPVESPSPPAPNQSRRGRVLVMDDESSILSLLSAALKRLGFDPVPTSDGKAAIEASAAAAAKGQPFDVAILDLTIPGGMGGVEAAGLLRAAYPNMLLVASSGYAQNPVLLNFRDFGFDQVLVKPYRIQDIAQLLAALLPDPGGDKTAT